MADGTGAPSPRPAERLRSRLSAEWSSLFASWPSPFWVGGSGLGGRDRMSVVVAWAIGICCVLSLAHRFRFGADVTDETFSIAMPYRFVLGDKPFVDEVSIQQTAGMLLYPFVWLFVKITGGSSGIVLFVRGIHLFYKAITAFCVYLAGRRLLEHRASAIAVAFVPFAFVHGTIPNVGYNLLGMTLTTAGTFLSAAALAYPSPRQNMVFYAGLLQAFAAYAYPPMVVGPLLAAVLVFVCAPKDRFSALVSFTAGCVLALAIVSPTFAFGGVAGIKRSLGFGVHDATPHGLEQVKAILRSFWDGAPGATYAYAAAALVLARITRWRPLVAVVVTVVTLALCLVNREEVHSVHASVHTVMYAGVAAPLFLLAARVDAKLLRAVLLVLVPSFACAVAAGTFSTQKVTATSLGLATTLVLMALLAARALERASADRTHCLLPAAGLMFVLVTQCWDYVYRDAPIAALTTKVKSGPFRGVFTTADRAAVFSEIETIARRYDREGGRVLYLYDMPGLYLFSRMRPSANTVWEVPYAGHEQLLAYWRTHVTGKGIAVVVKGTGGSPYVDPVVAAPERKIFETPHCTVYAEP